MLLRYVSYVYIRSREYLRPKGRGIKPGRD
jgi:hypothetical protein